MDLAASVQAVTEGSVVLRMTRALVEKLTNKPLFGRRVALNCVGNGKVLRDGAFENIWVQPAAGDSGGALGAGLTAYYIIWGINGRPTGRPMPYEELISAHNILSATLRIVSRTQVPFIQFCQIKMLLNRRHKRWQTKKPSHG